MRRAGGYAFISSPDGIQDEHDTFTCKHCNKIVHVMPKAKPEDLGGLCKVCMGLTCPQCSGLGCRPFEEQLKQWESKQDFLRQSGV